MIHFEVDNSRFVVWHYFQPCRRESLACGRHAIAAVLKGMGLEFPEVCKLMKNPNYNHDRTTVYNDLEAHESLIFTKNVMYVEIYERVRLRKKYIVNFLKARKMQDLSGCYCVDQAYEYGYQDALKRVHQLLGDKMNELEEAGVSDVILRFLENSKKEVMEIMP